MFGIGSLSCAEVRERLVGERGFYRTERIEMSEQFIDVLALDYPAPLQKVEQWGVCDSTKLTTYMDCPRKYLFSYIL